MLSKFRLGLIPTAVAVVLCLAGAFVPAPPDNPSNLDNGSTNGAQNASQTLRSDFPSTHQEDLYIGSDGCLQCHRKQSGTWSDTKHAFAFEHLPEKYRDDETCLACHVTAFREPGGFVPGMPADEAESFQSVGCEACHGPGANHVEGVKQWTLADAADEDRLLEEIKKSIIRTPPDSRCAVCHKAQSHQAHPPYDGQPEATSLVNDSSFHSTSAGLSPPPSPDSYSVKTCASCHYEKYKTWQIDKHVGLSSKIPAKYQADKKCLECHRQGSDSSQWHTVETDPEIEIDPVGVGCESCHGSGFKHVMYNKQLIGRLQLAPETELAARQLIREQKPVAACVQCHISERHREHPKFEKPEAATTN